MTFDESTTLAPDVTASTAPGPASDEAHQASARRPRALDRTLLSSVATTLAPNFPLRDAVAIHPMVGLFDRTYLEAAAWTRATVGADVLPSSAWLSQMVNQGAYERRDVEEVLTMRGRPVSDAGAILERLARAAAGQDPAPVRVSTMADDRSRVAGLDLDARADAVLIAWLSSRHDLGVSAFGGAQDRPDGFADFLAWASADRTLELAGVRGVRAFFRKLPRTRERALAVLGAQVRLRDVDESTYVRRLAAGILGWVGYLRGATFAAAPDDVDAVVDVLAARLALDVAIAVSPSFGDLDEAVVSRPAAGAPRAHDEDRMVLLHAAERALQRRFEEAVRPPAAVEPGTVHAVFCIDVRSEPARRALETALYGATTSGFAGFFGVSVEVEGGGPLPGGARCPALLTPSHSVRVDRPEGDAMQRVRDALTRMRRSLLGGLGHAELGLPLSLAPLLLGRAGGGRPDHEHHARIHAESIELDDRVTMAASALRAACPAGPLPRLVVLVGHDATSHNNPQHAALTCGACGGHGGAVNARLLASFLRDAAVRERLARLGIVLGPETTAIAAVHDTTTDTLTALDRAEVPASHAADVERLVRAFERTSASLRRARVPDEVCPHDELPDDLVRAAWLRRRAGDWAEPRPEWALANNALFVAARRSRTLGVDLGGRAFLHDYDESRDPDGALLRLILSAPMVVAAHINGAYGLSVTAPAHFGAGPKNVHTISGGVGVVRGNGGDLRLGLASESVFDEDGPVHEPLRLSVYVEASPARLTAALDALPFVRSLLDHEYVHLACLPPDRGPVVRYRPHHGF